MVQLLIDQCVLINQLEWEKKNQLEWLFFAEELACGSTVSQSVRLSFLLSALLSQFKLQHKSIDKKSNVFLVAGSQIIIDTIYEGDKSYNKQHLVLS
jgi:hypothetical protein